jgi:hypothetical protein
VDSSTFGEFLRVSECDREVGYVPKTREGKRRASGDYHQE